MLRLMLYMILNDKRSIWNPNLHDHVYGQIRLQKLIYPFHMKPSMKCSLANLKNILKLLHSFTLINSCNITPTR